MVENQVDKSNIKKIKFNLSPSSLNLYCESPLLFYLTYIGKVPDDTSVPVCYGLAGSIVHDCLELYAKGELDRDGACERLAERWVRFKLNFHRDVKGECLNQLDYLSALLKGFLVVEAHRDVVCEERLSFDFVESEEFRIGLKGIVDVQAVQKEDGKSVVIDYKTSNSVSQGREFERQALFYNLLLQKEKGIIPHRTSFHYLKLGIAKHHEFVEGDLVAFEEELHAVASEIMDFGDNIAKYPVGNIEGLFNSKKRACMNEVARRNAAVPRSFSSQMQLGI